jgi:hypothetical protein
MSKESIAGEFAELDARRSTKLTRCEELAKLTVPGLYPKSGWTETMDLPDLYSSIAARGIMSLASRMVSAIYPLNQMPFFQHEIDMAMVPQGADVTQQMQLLARLDKKIMEKLQNSNLRQELYVLMQHLITIGDALWYQSDDYSFRVYRVDQYVVVRYPDGSIKKIIVRDWIDPKAIPESWTGYPETGQTTNSGYLLQGPVSNFEPCYTEIEWDAEKEKWEVEKEFRGVVVEEGEYEVCPYTPQVWSRIAGEDYGRSLVEEHIGDIRSMEALSKATIEMAAASAEFRIGVDPTGITEIADLVDSVNGDFVAARPTDIFTLQLNRQPDLGPVVMARQELAANLGRTFLLQSAVQPTGDRVTATQIREIAQELDQALGGIFSGISRDIQIPIVKRTMFLLAKDRLIPKEILKLTGSGGILSMKVRTGLEALNREVQNSQLVQWAQVVGQIPNAMQAVNWDNWLIRFTTSFGMDVAGLVKTPEQLAQEQQAMMEQQAEMQANQQTIQSAGRIAEEQAAAGAME